MIRQHQLKNPQFQNRFGFDFVSVFRYDGWVLSHIGSVLHCDRDTTGSVCRTRQRRVNLQCRVRRVRVPSPANTARVSSDSACGLQPPGTARYARPTGHLTLQYGGDSSGGHGVANGGTGGTTGTTICRKRRFVKKVIGSVLSRSRRPSGLETTRRLLGFTQNPRFCQTNPSRRIEFAVACYWGTTDSDILADGDDLGSF